jgi:hypothetical protein
MDFHKIRLKRENVYTESSMDLYSLDKFKRFMTQEEIDRYEQDGDVDIELVPEDYGDAEDIPIELLKEMIEKAEKAGANYIQVDWHCDHGEYDIYGYNITRFTKEQEEAREKVERVGEKMKISGKIRNLEAQIEELKKQQESI